MTTKNLIICPTCAMHGRREILGEIDPLGKFVIMRFHQGYTKVVATIYQVQCGRCDNIAYNSSREEAYGTVSMYQRS